MESTTSAFKPRSPSSKTWKRPQGPAPTMTTSVSITQIVRLIGISKHYHGVIASPIDRYLPKLFGCWHVVVINTHAGDARGHKCLTIQNRSGLIPAVSRQKHGGLSDSPGRTDDSHIGLRVNDMKRVTIRNCNGTSMCHHSRGRSVR